MLGLVKPDLSSARKPDPGERAPPCLFHVRAPDALGFECPYLGLQIVTHEEELVLGLFIGGVNGRLCRRKREDQSTVASVHGRKPEDLAEKGAVGRRIGAVDDHVGTKDHTGSFL